MNWATDHVAGAVQDKTFYRQKGAGQRSYTSKKWIGCSKVTFL